MVNEQTQQISIHLHIKYPFHLLMSFHIEMYNSCGITSAHNLWAISHAIQAKGIFVAYNFQWNSTWVACYIHQLYCALRYLSLNFNILAFSLLLINMNSCLKCSWWKNNNSVFPISELLVEFNNVSNHTIHCSCCCCIISSFFARNIFIHFSKFLRGLLYGFHSRHFQSVLLS